MDGSVLTSGKYKLACLSIPNVVSETARLTSPSLGQEDSSDHDHDLDVELYLANRIYKRDRTGLDGIALHRTIPTLV
jgi:hypothetical protein